MRQKSDNKINEKYARNKKTKRNKRDNEENRNLHKGQSPRSSKDLQGRRNQQCNSSINH